MNWGARIVVLYGGFVVLILVMVFAAAKQDFHLVTEDYYAEEIQYQDQIYATRNAKALAEPLQIQPDYRARQLALIFPADQAAVSGSVQFYKPDNAKLDREVPLQLTGREQLISLADFHRGRWIVKVRWQHDSTSYFQESSLLVQ